MNSKEISNKYLTEKNNISKYPIDKRFADSHWELKEKFDNICEIAKQVALKELKNTKFKYATYSRMDVTNNKGIIITLYTSQWKPNQDFSRNSADVLIAWDTLDEILKQKNNTVINITVKSHLENGKMKYVINNSHSIKESIDFICENKLSQGVKLSLQKANEYYSVKHEDSMTTFLECGILLERGDNLVSSSGFLKLMKDEILELEDVIYLIEFGVIIVSPTRNKIILL